MKKKLGVFLTTEDHAALRVAAAKDGLSMTRKAEEIIREALLPKKKIIAKVAK